MPIHLTPLEPSDLSSDYGDIAIWYDIGGLNNVKIYSDLQDTGNQDDARIQRWMDFADDFINNKWKDAGETTTPIVAGDDRFLRLQRIHAMWGIAMMAKGRGDIPSQFSTRDAFDNQMDGLIERAEKELDAMIEAWKVAQDGTAGSAGIESIPLTFGDSCAACDENGCM